MWYIPCFLFPFKACVRYFLPNFYFQPNDSPLKHQKCFLFHVKSSFLSRHIQTFVFPSSHLFLSVGHYVRGCLKKNLKVYDVINCLNKNLITPFVWYFEKEGRYDIEALSIDRVLNNIFMEKSSRKCVPKASPKPIFIFCK